MSTIYTHQSRVKTRIARQITQYGVNMDQNGTIRTNGFKNSFNFFSKKMKEEFGGGTKEFTVREVRLSHSLDNRSTPSMVYLGLAISDDIKNSGAP